ncbi:MAG TPA: PilZ domain-containing protein, partial [Dehalococcoidia bacterium]|nr:PilZ domain-containing protein [Dehalococcoidia bacterium]
MLIAPAEHLGGLQEQRGLKGAQTFPDSEATAALDVITRERPKIIALEREFAASRRGLALMNRIKADPSLATSEVRIVYSRRAPRFRVASMHAIIDGNPALIIDISMIGAQVVSSTALRPNQRIRMSLEGDQGLRFNAAVAWATFELPAEGPRYRAGIHFHDAN